jgi:heme A synthase
VDVGSALLVVALIVTTTVVALAIHRKSTRTTQLSYKSMIGRLVIAATAVVYLILVSGVLVSGNNSITACLGWPVYSLQLFHADVHVVLKTSRLILSLAGIVLVLVVLITSWRARVTQPRVYATARWVGVFFLVEAILQILLLVFNLPVSLLIPYTITMTVFWAMLVALLVTVGLETGQR